MPRWGATFYVTQEPPPKVGARMPLTCPVCGTHTDAKIVAQSETPQSDFVRLPSMTMRLLNFLVECTYCRSGLLVLFPYGSEYTGQFTAATAYVYPLRSSDLETTLIKSDAIPKAIAFDLEQAELAYYAGAHYGAGLLLRRACQNICRERNIPEVGGQGLKGQIAEMAARGIITKVLAEMADTVRVIGNELAHPDPNTPMVITVDDVKAAREFMLQFVRAIYVDPEKAAAVKAELAKKGVK